jgi:hypothetical protein
VSAATVLGNCNLRSRIDTLEGAPLKDIEIAIANRNCTLPIQHRQPYHPRVLRGAIHRQETLRIRLADI